uniref:Synaptophysin like 1 n=1 Tax=Anser brachyrhynchus TaxID=132585 RepID=A0A8B9C6H5_9AVES
MASCSDVAIHPKIASLVVFFFSIFAFATCGGYSGKVSYWVSCNGKPNVTVTVPFGYPFRLNQAVFSPPTAELCNKTEPGEVHLVGDFSSSAQFFVTVAVFAFLYSMAALAVYLGYFHLYRGAGGKLPLAVSPSVRPSILVVVVVGGPTGRTTAPTMHLRGSPSLGGGWNRGGWGGSPRLPEVWVLGSRRTWGCPPYLGFGGWPLALSVFGVPPPKIRVCPPRAFGVHLDLRVLGFCSGIWGPLKFLGSTWICGIWGSPGEIGVCSP